VCRKHDAYSAAPHGCHGVTVRTRLGFVSRPHRRVHTQEVMRMRDVDTEARGRPAGELLKELSDQTTTLVRREIELAKVEHAQKGKRAGIGGGMFEGAGLLEILALACLTTCAILALATAVAAWLAALIVAVVYVAVAGALALSGKKQVSRARPPVPEQAFDSTKEDLEWVRNGPRPDGATDRRPRAEVGRAAARRDRGRRS
jgi:hypothetical protein